MYAVNMMLSATLMIIVIEIVRRFAGNRLPRWSFCALWTMVCARLLIPFAAENGYIHYTLILKAVWILGAVAFAVYFTAVYSKNVCKFRESLPVNSDEAESMRKRMHIKRKVSVRESDYIASPLTYGLFLILK